MTQECYQIPLKIQFNTLGKTTKLHEKKTLKPNLFKRTGYDGATTAKIVPCSTNEKVILQYKPMYIGFLNEFILIW